MNDPLPSRAAVLVFAACILAGLLAVAWLHGGQPIEEPPPDVALRPVPAP